MKLMIRTIIIAITLFIYIFGLYAWAINGNIAAYGAFTKLLLNTCFNSKSILYRCCRYSNNIVVFYAWLRFIEEMLTKDKWAILLMISHLLMLDHGKVNSVVMFIVGIHWNNNIYFDNREHVQKRYLRIDYWFILLWSSIRFLMKSLIILQMSGLGCDALSSNEMLCI